MMTIRVVSQSAKIHNTMAQLKNYNNSINNNKYVKFNKNEDYSNSKGNS